MLSFKQVFAYSIKQIFSICFLAVTFLSFSALVKAQNTEKKNQIPTNQQINKVEELKLNKPIERHIKDNETHSFQFTVKAGFYARAEVEQKNIDVVVSLLAPNGKFVVEMDGKGGRLWREPVSCIAETSGVYRIEIKAYAAGDATGNYTVELADMRLSNPNDRKWIEAESRLSAGRKFYMQGRAKHLEAVKEYEAAIILWRELSQAGWEGVTLADLGSVFRALSKDEQAIDAHMQAMDLFQKTKNRASEAKIANYLGKSYESLNQYDKAREFFEKALIISHEIGDRRGEGEILANLGYLFHHSLKQYEKAKDYYEQALTIRREFKQRRGEESALTSLYLIYSSLGQWEKSRNYHEQALSIRQELGDRNSEIVKLMDLGEDNEIHRQYEKARDYYEQALVILRESRIQRPNYYRFWHEATTLGQLVYIYEKLGKSSLAILYGKETVNLYQNLLEETRNESRDLFLKISSITFRLLVDLLIADGRLPEAQVVLDLLKEEEYKKITTLRSGENPETIPYSKAETEVVAKIENLVALERERREIQKLSARTAEQEAKLEQLRLDIVAANKAFDVALDALGKTEASASTRVDEIKGGQELQGALTTLAKKTKSGVVALYTILGTEEKDAQGKPVKDKTKTKFGWVIMVREGTYTAYPIDVANLEETIFQFLNVLSSDKYDPQPLAAKIYTAIFRQPSKQKRTLDQDLQDYFKSSKDKTIMWSLDGALRYIPMAALHDGNNYLVENYRNIVFTKNSLASLTTDNEAVWQILGAGVSEKRENFNALPGVKTELETIVREPNNPNGILNGIIRRDNNFKKQTFLNTLTGGAYPVVHIASHYSFDTAKQENSFLLVGDGRLTFAEMKDNKNLFGTVDLLTLSACDTGVSGNGKEAEGFAYMAQSLGAKSVIASLWKVSDVGTPELMIRFYKLIAEHPEMTKGEAFRQAQLSLLGTETKNTKTSNVRRAEIVSLSGNKIELPLFEKRDKAQFAHPHYWSSFVLIGNWR